MLEAICAARNPRSALNWLRRRPGAALLADLAAGKLPASHQALDAHPRRRAADFLRHMLTAGGVLPPRDEELARTGQWLTGILQAAEPDTARRLVRAYATWQVMRPLRASAGRAARPRTYTAHARRNIRAAASFLTWLHGRGRALAACRQADVESWLATGPPACQVRDFLSWAARHEHCQAFAIPGPARASGDAASQDERWALTARLLHDDTLDLTDRAAGCLLLLYGQQLSRIAAMTITQVSTRDDSVHIRLGDHHIPVPEPLGIVLAELLRPAAATPGPAHQSSPRGCSPAGCPASRSPPAGSGPLRALGIYAKPGRRAALLDLAAQLPARRPRRPPGSGPAPQSDGCARPEATGPATRPKLTRPGITNPDQCTRRRTPRSTYSAWLVNRSLPVSSAGSGRG